MTEFPAQSMKGVKDIIEERVTTNFGQLKLRDLLYPLVILLSLIVFLWVADALTVENFIAIQKDLFFYLNKGLSVVPSMMNNLTQFGDALIVLCLAFVFVRYSSKLWGATLNALILTAAIAPILKLMLHVPRPAFSFNQNEMTIIGETLTGRNSLPSGHSMAFSAIFTVLFIGLRPMKKMHRLYWTVLYLTMMFLVLVSRIAVGAHYPLDVLFGGAIGVVLSIVGVFISNKVHLWSWFDNRKIYPFILILILVWIGLIINEIIKMNLLVYYFSITCLLITFYALLAQYIKQRS